MGASESGPTPPASLPILPQRAWQGRSPSAIPPAPATPATAALADWDAVSVLRDQRVSACVTALPYRGLCCWGCYSCLGRQVMGPAHPDLLEPVGSERREPPPPARAGELGLDLLLGLGTVQITAGTLSVSNCRLSNGAHGTRWRKSVWRRWGLLMRFDGVKARVGLGQGSESP